MFPSFEANRSCMEDSEDLSTVTGDSPPSPFHCEPFCGLVQSHGRCELLPLAGVF